ncbi:DUF6082 family protein [Paractinoplanes deccanensis]
MISNLRYLFASPKIRAFWGDTRDGRHTIYVDNTAEATFASAADEIWREYEAVLSWGHVRDKTSLEDEASPATAGRSRPPAESRE